MAIHEIRVDTEAATDSRAGIINAELRTAGLVDIGAVTSTTVYRFEGISENDAVTLASAVIADPITQRVTVGVLPDTETASHLEIGYRPGVMNPTAASLLLAADTQHISPVAATNSVEFTIPATVPQEILARIGEKLASQVETVIWQTPETLLVRGTAGPIEQVPILRLNGDELDALSQKRRLFQTRSEMKIMQAYYRTLGREPTDVEIEMLAQTWSEHCLHKTFKAKLTSLDGKEHVPLITRIRQTSQKYFEKVGVVSAFSDNAGGIRFYDGQVIIAKGETHNSPVAVEPYGGSMTKNGGVYRDIAGFGLGGENILALMVNCFGFPDAQAWEIPPNTLHPKHLLLENFRGERDYGNRMGIPTHATTLHFHKDFGPKPTSMGIVVGIIPEKDSQKGEPVPGDYVVTIGGKTGKDGIHGATFSSGEMTADTSTIDSTAVQIGNSIEEKRMFDAIIAARDAGLIRAITDCGAGGYSSAVGEIAEGVGATVQLADVPLKYEGMAPWEIWVSESQERMVLAIAPEHWEHFLQICRDFEVPADIIGRFTGDKQITIAYGEKTVGQLPTEFLHHGLPQREMTFTHIPAPEIDDLPAAPTDWTGVYTAVLGHLNVASTEEMLRQFDTTVQGRTVLHPFGGIHQDAPNDASVLAPIYGKPYGVVTAHALNPILNRLDPYHGTQWAVAAAASKFVSAGGNIREAAMIDNFVWPKPSEKFLGDLDRSVDGLCGMMDIVEMPCVSGKDSLSSTYTHDGTEINIPPVLNMTVFGRIPDVAKTISSDIKQTGSTLVLIGNPDPDALGGSVYFQALGIENTRVPKVDTATFAGVLHGLTDAIGTGEIQSCKAVAEGGIATALAQMCFGGDVGCDVNFEMGDHRMDLTLFAETPGMFIVEMENEESAHALLGSLPHMILGKTTAEKSIRVSNNGSGVFESDLDDLKKAWQEPMKELLSGN